MKLALVLFFMVSLAVPETLALGSSLAFFSLEGVGQFLTSIKSMFGSGGDFAQKYGYNYRDIYNDQLMLQAVKTYSNDRQKEEEVKQVHEMQKDIANETVYFTIICTFLILNSVLLSILTCVKIREQMWSISSKTKTRIIDDYVRDQELKSVSARV